MKWISLEWRAADWPRLRTRALVLRILHYEFGVWVRQEGGR